MTPDSSRFWDAATYEPGRPQASFDKQFVRDWLEAQPWDKTAPGPALPDDVVDGTRARYIEAYERITGASFERYLQEDVIARMTSFRFAVNVLPKPGILDPQGRAVEGSLGHLGIEGVSAVRVGRRVELTVEAPDAAAARAVVGPARVGAPVEPAHRGVRDRGPRRRPPRSWPRGRLTMSVRIGVVVFPGSNCDRDTRPRARAGRRRAGRPVARAGVARRGRRGDPAGRLRLRRLPPGRASSRGSAR